MLSRGRWLRLKQRESIQRSPLGATTMTDPSSANRVGAEGEAIGVSKLSGLGQVKKGGRARARGGFFGSQAALRWPEASHRAQHTRSLQS
jgi:hypothetical protein